MTNPPKSKAALLAALGDDLRVYRQGASVRWRGAAQEVRRRLRRGEPAHSAAVTESGAAPKPGLLALLEDDIRQSWGALSGELKRLRGKIRLPLERRREEGVATSASPESVPGSGSPGDSSPRSHDQTDGSAAVQKPAPRSRRVRIRTSEPKPH